MKKAIITAGILAGIFSTTKSNAAVDTVFLCHGNNIQFSVDKSFAPSINDVKWSFDGITAIAATTSESNIYLHESASEYAIRFKAASNEFSATGSSVIYKTIYAQVTSEEGCNSLLDTFVVAIFPTPALTVSNVTNYCVNNTTETTLTTTAASVSNLPTGVSLNTFTWTKDGATITEGITSSTEGSSTLTYMSPTTTTPVVYGASVSYTLPAGKSFIGNSCNSAEVTRTVESYPVPTKPLIEATSF